MHRLYLYLIVINMHIWYSLTAGQVNSKLQIIIYQEPQLLKLSSITLSRFKFKHFLLGIFYSYLVPSWEFKSSKSVILGSRKHWKSFYTFLGQSPVLNILYVFLTEFWGKRVKMPKMQLIILINNRKCTCFKFQVLNPAILLSTYTQTYQSVWGAGETKVFT